MALNADAALNAALPQPPPPDYNNNDTAGSGTATQATPRVDWEKESPADRLARPNKYIALATDKESKTTSLQQQAEAMASSIIDIEDFFLYVRTFNLDGASAQQKRTYDVNMGKVKGAIKKITNQLDVLHVANKHGWDIAKRLIEKKAGGRRPRSSTRNRRRSEDHS